LQGNALLFNNPNPYVTRPIQEMVEKILKCEKIAEAAWFHEITTKPIVLASHILRHGALEKSTRIGGAIHSLLVSRSGDFFRQAIIQPAE